MQQEYRELLLRGLNFTTLAVSAAIAERAAELRARYRLRTPDALQIATALEADCEAFLSNDTGLRRVTELRVLLLDDLEL
ncbi:MAG: PIN domain-containing protein [Acidobacteriota bacterium]